MSSLERWHRIHDAAVDAGCDETEACLRADERYWPHDEPKPEAIRLEVSPFRDPALSSRTAPR